VAVLAVPAVGRSSKRIDLVEFGRVVEPTDEPTRATTSADELVRGSEGWDAVRGPDGQYTIGVEWDKPREITEVNIEFRHAIASRDQIKVQYWRTAPSGAAKSDRPAGAGGEWRTPKAEWWAGDRDVSFLLLPADQEGPRRDGGRDSARRTNRIRFLCGNQDDLPPVRYLRAFGPAPVATDTFDVRFDRQGDLTPPIMCRIVNGFFLAGDAKTTMTSAIVHQQPGSLQIRYARTDSASPNRTHVTLGPVDQSEVEYGFYPAEVARRGQVRLNEAGMLIERRGGKPAESQEPAATRPGSPARPEPEPKG